MTNEEFLDAFSKCTNAKVAPDGRTTINCKHGLWGVNAPNRESALRMVSITR